MSRADLRKAHEVGEQIQNKPTSRQLMMFFVSKLGERSQAVRGAVEDTRSLLASVAEAPGLETAVRERLEAYLVEQESLSRVVDSCYAKALALSVQSGALESFAAEAKGLLEGCEVAHQDWLVEEAKRAEAAKLIVLPSSNP